MLCEEEATKMSNLVSRSGNANLFILTIMGMNAAESVIQLQAPTFLVGLDT